MKISFNFLEKITLTNRTGLKAFIARMFEMEKCKAGQINFIFCSDEFLLEINKTYLQHDYYTDIITFNLSAEGSSFIDGEVYISIDTITDNALRFSNSVSKELHRVMFHGILHLIGYDDSSQRLQTIMTDKEDFYLQLYFDQG